MEGTLRLGSIDQASWVATIGNFDGFHLGHQHVFDKLRIAARLYRSKIAVFSFSPHPITVLKPEIDKRFIYSENDKIRLFSDWGADIIFMIDFNKELSQMTAEQFFTEKLLPFHPLKKLVVGADFCFGNHRQGSVARLGEFCNHAGLELEVVPLLQSDNRVISSSVIRQLLQKGDFLSVSKMLGRMWSVRGKVVKGNMLGRKIGFPTANLSLSHAPPLAYGSYACLVKHRGQSWLAAANYGIKPTFKDNKPTFEVHLLNFEFDIYNQELQVFVLHKLRDEKKFTSLSDLKEAIRADINHVRNKFKVWQQKFSPYLLEKDYANSCES
ncbi:MAG: bifunctional riboflavin kinase/FAD synthetase [SAR324 cluster bacterium]|nr:bifunctional riboflavin kinase/FAD synthetase [SAR324 cluster bacterium]